MKKLQARAKEIKKQLENTPGTTSADMTRAPVCYTGRDKHAIPEFKQSPQFSQFKEEYIATVQGLRNLVRSSLKDNNNAFDKFLDRVFPPDGLLLDPNASEINYLSHQFYQLKGCFEETLCIMEGLKAQLGQGETPEENQKRQESFELKIAFLATLREELQNACADGLLTYASDVALKLRAGETSTLWSGIETEIMLLADEVISRQIVKYYSDEEDSQQSVHIASSYRKALGLPTLGDDRYATTIKEARITEAREALNAELTVSRVLSWSRMDEYLAALPHSLRKAISVPLSRYITGNLATVRESLFSAFEKDREKKSALTLEMIKALPVNVWQEVLREIPPDRLFASDHKIGRIPWSEAIRTTLDSTGGAGAFENYLNRYLADHPDYLGGLAGIAKLPQSLKEIIRPQISAYIQENIPAVRASLLATIEEEAIERTKKQGYDIEDEDNSPVLKNLKLLTADTWQAVLREIPPDIFFPLCKVYIGAIGWNWSFKAILDEKGGPGSFDRYISTYRADHPDYLGQLGQDVISRAPAFFRQALGG